MQPASAAAQRTALVYAVGPGRCEVMGDKHPAVATTEGRQWVWKVWGASSESTAPHNKPAATRWHYAQPEVPSFCHD